jgi:hypothetical protein
LCLSDDRASLLEEKLYNQLTQAKIDGSFQANFTRINSAPCPLSTPNSHSFSQMGLHFGDHVKRFWSYWGLFDGDAVCLTNHSSTLMIDSLSYFNIQTEFEVSISDDIQSKIQHELLPTIKRQMRQIENFLQNLKFEISDKEMDKYLNIFNDHEVRTLEELKQLTNEIIEEIIQSADMPDEIGEAIYAFRDNYIESMLTTQLNQHTVIEDALEYIREQIPSDFNRDELSNVLKDLQSKKVDTVLSLQGMDKRTYQRLLKRLNLNARATDLLMFLHRVELSASTAQAEEDQDDEEEEKENHKNKEEEEEEDEEEEEKD